MRKEYTRPVTGEVDTDVNVFSIIQKRAEERPDDAVIGYKDDAGEWAYMSGTEYLNRIIGVAKGLIAKGLQKGDRVSILSKTRWEWAAIDLAVMAVGGITVPIYETNSELQIKAVINDSQVSMVFAEDDAQRDKVEAIKDECPTLRDVYVIDEGAVDALTELGRGVKDEEFWSREKQSHGKDVCTIVYTSGSTGKPKGVELTHANFVFITYSGVRSMPDICLKPNRRLLLFLPMAHVFARYMQFYSYAGTVVLGLNGNFKTIIKDFQDFKPTFILSVPRVFEKVYNAATQKAGSGFKGRMFHDAAVTARAWSHAQQEGRKLGFGMRLKYALYKKLVYKQILDVFGGNAEYAVSGGAPLDGSISHFFNGCGLPLLEGFGMTETTAPACVNPEHGYKIGSVGLPLEGMTFGVADDGELCIKGGSVMKGYLNNPQSTEESIVDGWLHTGDLGDLDDDGFVYITGRKKDIIITAGGKNVTPAQPEATIMTSPVVDQCLVIGDRKPFVAALVTLDFDGANEWLKSQGGEPCASLEEAARNPVIRAEIDRVVNKANENVSRAESIRKFEVLPDKWTQENGMLTASLKTRRGVIVNHYKDLIDTIIYVPRNRK
ncbi:MAG: AMP-dependent synthetase/ligase [Bifidobacteriaceae bacterium]|nr:AMP-dependent synthetase/ligase [Bifidobacteriaceae bacterium]